MKKLLILATILFTIGFVNAQTFVRQGDNKYSSPLNKWDGTCLGKDDNKYSSPLLNIDGKIPNTILIFISE